MVATALPRDRTVTTSPEATSRNTPEKCRLASAAEMVFMMDLKGSVKHYVKVAEVVRQEFYQNFFRKKSQLKGKTWTAPSQGS
jgi:hypothetical protein